uniref:Uncharacterized protein n=1 Tax=Rhizophora mucronata TaxID=61149 RepID=A0A2P2J9Y4_RHIMU
MSMIFALLPIFKRYREAFAPRLMNSHKKLYNLNFC